MKKLLLLALMLSTAALFAQEAPKDWWDLDRADDAYPGVSANKALNYLQGKKGQTVVVAVIDSGVDIEHEDLKDIIWTNPVMLTMFTDGTSLAAKMAATSTAKTWRSFGSTTA